ncbi:MAG: S-layer homology domain-containing protein [Clostridiales bacterium]|nr:S-layer homology domain-containing protein [Clostridiales bacterium]
MTKRIIALLLALILTVGLLPTVALADDAQPDVQVSKSDDNLNLVKTIKKAGENYTVTLESWATGEVTSSSTPVPMDIVLLLDQSGSMSYDFTSSSTTEYNRLYKKNQKIYTDYSDKLYIYDGSKYVKVRVEKQTIVFSKDKFTYTWEGGSYVSYGENDYPDRTFYYQSTNSSKTTKIAALKSAVRSFIGKVNEEATNKNVDHRVAIVGFASTKSGSSYRNTELLSTQNEVNYANAKANNYKDALVSVKTSKSRLDTAIGRLEADGDTYPEYGFDMANKIFAQYPIQAGDNRQRVVIMFTDGYPAPAYTDDFDVGMANNAINNAKSCKDNNAKVYTIGIFDGADPSAPIENYYQNNWLNQGVAANRYMHFSSSNYPSAKALNNGGTRGEGNFYFAASNADALNDIFDAISEEISTDTTELDGSATIIDNIPGNFAIPAIPAKAQGITLTVANYKADGSFEAATTAPAGVTAKHENGTVTVTGFDFSDNWCGVDQDGKAHGQKLIIEFTIKHNNYGGTQPTNAGASIKDKEGNEVIKVDDPSIPVTISKPVDIFASAIEKPYDGTGFDILNKVAEKANTLADGTNNAFVDIEVKITVEGTDYIYTISKGQRSGTWNQTASPKTSPNVKDKDKDGTPEAYEYPVKITFKDAEGVAAENYTTTTAKFTIKYAEATVKANDKSKKATEADPAFDATVTGMVNGEKAEEKLTYTITRTDEDNNTVGYHTTITPAGQPYQNNYKVTYETGTLTITKDDTTEIELIIVGNTLEQTYDGQVHTANNYKVTYPAGTFPTDFQIVTSKTASVSATDVKTTAEGTVDADGRYMMGLTAEDFTVTSEKYGKIKVTYTDGWVKINPRPITLKSGDASKTYDGAPLTEDEVKVTSGSFAKQEGLNYTVTGSQTEVGHSDNTYTYIEKTGTTLTNYTITEEKGTLTVTLPDPSIPTVTVDCINPDVSHSEKTGITLTAATQYELGDPQKVINESAYTRTITLTSAGKEYCIGEYNNDIPGHTEAAGGTTTITLKYSKEGSDWAWRATPANFLVNVQCNTPTVNVNLGDYIKKTLTGTNFHENFSAEFKVDVAYSCNGNKTAVGSVTLTGAAVNTQFIFSNITLKRGFYYTFSVTEQEANIPGVTCDTTTHEFALNVKTDGTVEFGSVVDKQFVPAGAESDKFLTITNTYTKPTYAVGKFVIESAASDDFPTEGVNADDYQYPTNGKFIVEKTYTDDTITFLYVIEVSGKNGAEMTIQEKDGGKFISVDYSTETRATINPNAAQDTYTVKLTADVDASDPIKLYAKKTFTKVEGKFPTTATNALLVNGEEGPKQNTTIEERGALTVDFGALVQKHLTVTGDKSFNGTNFTVNFTGGRYDPLVVSNSIEVYADAGVGEEKLPDLTASVTYTADERNRGLKDFDGADLTINTEGYYSYIVSEQIPAGATGYDTKKYVVGIVVVPDGDGLIVDYVWYHELVEDLATYTENIPGGPTFYNTIDTGRDDYIPIIIPTIINKDTGMLNKTDHFAYVIGYPDGTVHPNGQITRAEVATIFFRLLRDEVRDGAFTTSNSYSDVAYGKWYNNPISTMSALGIITGYPDGTFKPNKPITRAEFAAIAARFDETQSGKSATFSDVIGHWAAKEIGIAYYNDWIKGYPDGTFKPDQNITRAEAMTLINRVLERKPESPADLLTNMNKWTDNMDTSKWYYLDVQEATNSHGYTRKTFNYELWRQMLPDPDWSRYER